MAAVAVERRVERRRRRGMCMVAVRTMVSTVG